MGLIVPMQSRTEPTLGGFHRCCSKRPIPKAAYVSSVKKIQRKIKCLVVIDEIRVYGRGWCAGSHPGGLKVQPHPGQEKGLLFPVPGLANRHYLYGINDMRDM
jgi:hypothetical protein